MNTPIAINASAYRAFYNQNQRSNRTFNILEGISIGGAPIKNFTASLYDHALNSAPYDTQAKRDNLIYAVEELDRSRGADPKYRNKIDILVRKAQNSGHFTPAEIEDLKLHRN